MTSQCQTEKKQVAASCRLYLYSYFTGFEQTTTPRDCGHVAWLFAVSGLDRTQQATSQRRAGDAEPDRLLYFGSPLGGPSWRDGRFFAS
jgi:hypothetical protein